MVSLDDIAYLTGSPKKHENWKKTERLLTDILLEIKGPPIKPNVMNFKSNPLIEAWFILKGALMKKRNWHVFMFSVTFCPCIYHYKGFCKISLNQRH